MHRRINHSNNKREREKNNEGEETAEKNEQRYERFKRRSDNKKKGEGKMREKKRHYK